MSGHRTHITTERLVLRPFGSLDVDAVIAIAGDWHVARMTADLNHPMTAAAAQLWLQPAYCDVRFAIQLAGAVIGSIGYYIDSAPGSEADGLEPKGCEPANGQAASAELGFFLARSHWGKGYAREAAGAVISHGFGCDGITKFTSSHFIDNAPSAGVLLDLGFRALHRGSVWCEARGHDVERICYEMEPSAADHLAMNRDVRSPGDAMHYAGVASCEPDRHDARGPQ